MVDETGSLKKGNKSVGVPGSTAARLGKDRELPDRDVLDRTLTAQGRALLDRELYLPGECGHRTMPLERRREAGVPEKAAVPVRSRNWPWRMLERALESGVPSAGLPGDEVYGNDRNLRLGWLEPGETFHTCWPSMEQ